MDGGNAENAGAVFSVIIAKIFFFSPSDLQLVVVARSHSLHS